MPTSFDLARMRATAAGAMPDLARIWRRTAVEATPDAYGGSGTTYNLAQSDVPVRLAIAGDSDRQQADTIRDPALVICYFPVGIDIQDTDRIEVNSTTYVVSAAVIAPSYELEREVEATRL